MRDSSLWAIPVASICIGFSIALCGSVLITPAHETVRQVLPMNAQLKTLPPGKWGGNGIAMVVGKRKATIEYPCATGDIDGQITLDRKGDFHASGYHTVAFPGPLRKDAPSNRSMVVFEGRVKGDSMTLKVIRKENNEVLGEFELKKDAPARIKRCL